MSHEDLPSFEIGHFEASIEQMVGGLLKYIVCRVLEDYRFILHADAKMYTHSGIAKKVNGDSSSVVVGGGFVAWGGDKFTLRGSSETFGEEPGDFRLAFITLLNERFHDDLQKYIESRTSTKEG
jgi:hypothetical protein